MSILCRFAGHLHTLTYTLERRLFVCARCSHTIDDGPVLRPEHGHAAVRARTRQMAHDARIVEARDRRAASMSMPARDDTRKPRLVRSR